MQELRFLCPKCGNTDCEVDQMRATRSFLGKIFDVQSRRFTTVTCTRCRYTELYDAPSSRIGDIFDFLTS